MNYQDPPAMQQERQRMVSEQIQARGVSSPQVLEAMRTVPRHVFMPEAERHAAYQDRPIPIGKGQTISQPYIVAYMTEALQLEGGEKVLEIGTGMGYQAAVLSRIASQVFTVERIKELADTARKHFAQLGYDNIELKLGDGTLGWEEQAPFEAIIVTAGGPRVPETFKSQLAMGGRLVIPVGGRYYGQRLVRITRTGIDTFEEEELLGVAFVPLVGEAGWGAEV